MKNMVEFKDISNFSNIGDYLPILNAVLFVDVSGIYLSLNNVIKSISGIINLDSMQL